MYVCVCIYIYIYICIYICMFPMYPMYPESRLEVARESSEACGIFVPDPVGCPCFGLDVFYTEWVSVFWTRCVLY